MIIKYKLSDFAKDVAVQNKQVVDLLSGKFGEVKKHTTPLSEEELDYLFEHLTREAEVASFEDYLASAPAPAPPPADKPAAAKPAAGTAPAARACRARRCSSIRCRRRYRPCEPLRGSLRCSMPIVRLGAICGGGSMCRSTAILPDCGRRRSSRSMPASSLR